MLSLTSRMSKHGRIMLLKASAAIKGSEEMIFPSLDIKIRWHITVTERLMNAQNKAGLKVPQDISWGFVGEADHCSSLLCPCSQPGDMQGCCELYIPLARPNLPHSSQEKVAQDQGFFSL